jgi:hypothetical protein
VRTCMLAGMDQTGESQISLTDPDSRAMASVTVFAVAPEKMLGCAQIRHTSTPLCVNRRPTLTPVEMALSIWAMRSFEE